MSTDKALPPAVAPAITHEYAPSLKNRMVVWEGAGPDGTPLVVLATGFDKASANGKTGDEIQTFILRADMDPMTALKSGGDTAICFDCPHRAKTSGGTGACYVRVYHAPLSTWRAHQRNGSMPFDPAKFAGRKVRIGSYGDPAAVPMHVWHAIAGTADGVTGYTHQWRTTPELSAYCMASVDDPSHARVARAAGFRSFIVRGADAPKPAGAVICPASAEAGKRTTCASCMQCGGTSGGRKADITIIAHGSTARAFKSLPLSVVA